MEELELACDHSNNDSIQCGQSERLDKIIIDIYEDEQQARVLLGKEKATHLRDWLNEFLGESK